MRLVQFQCQKEGTLFYYQTGVMSPYFITRCPMCGSRRISMTGRTFAPLPEFRLTGRGGDIRDSVARVLANM